MKTKPTALRVTLDDGSRQAFEALRLKVEAMTARLDRIDNKLGERIEFIGRLLKEDRAGFNARQLIEAIDAARAQSQQPPF